MGGGSIIPAIAMFGMLCFARSIAARLGFIGGTGGGAEDPLGKGGRLIGGGELGRREARMMRDARRDFGALIIGSVGRGGEEGTIVVLRTGDGVLADLGGGGLVGVDGGIECGTMGT
jgi:hypothetical protein